MLQEQVEFAAADGTALRGVLYRPAGPEAGRGPGHGGPTPGVVMSHGFSAVKEMCLPSYAEAVCARGVTVLLYDHRGLGSSDGEPRQRVNPWAQIRDMQQALAWLGDHPEVDAGRLGLWGSSFSGGEVLVLGAVDDRVRAVVANVPFAGLPGEDHRADTAGVVAAVAAELADGPLAAGAAVEGPGASVMGPMAVVEEEGNDLPVFLGHPESAAWFLSAGAGTAWRNEVTLVNAFGTEPPFDPGACVAHLRCPTLFVVASGDRVAEASVALRGPRAGAGAQGAGGHRRPPLHALHGHGAGRGGHRGGGVVRPVPVRRPSAGRLRVHLVGRRGLLGTSADPTSARARPGASCDARRPAGHPTRPPGTSGAGATARGRRGPPVRGPRPGARWCRPGPGPR